jgi:hypothetical protein
MPQAPLLALILLAALGACGTAPLPAAEPVLPADGTPRPPPQAIMLAGGR